MGILGKNILANLLSNAWSTVLMLSLTPVYISFLGVESYGLIGFYMSWIAILGILDTGISATASREIAWLSVRPKEKRKISTLLRSLEVVYWGIILVLGLGILSGAWLYGADWFQTKELSPELLRDALMLMAVSLVIQLPSGLYIGGLMGLQKQVECAGLVAFFGTVRGVGAVVVLWVVSPDIKSFFLWHILVSALQTGVIRWSLWKKVHSSYGSASFSKEVLHSIKGFAGGMTLITTLGIVISQADKMILSRLVSLEIFGFYMLAWTVASGLSRVATPLIQAFGPHFTGLLSRENEDVLARQVSLANQLMSVLILPPAVMISFLSEPILYVWIGNPSVASDAAPILSVLIVGMALSACSYPALSVLYSRKRLRPVITVNVIALVILLPLLVVSVMHFGSMGAAFIWGLYGLMLFVAYQMLEQQGRPIREMYLSMHRSFVIPCLVSFIVSSLIWHLNSEGYGKLQFIALLVVGLIVGWLSALLACKDLRSIVMDKFK